jgi:glycosyltransferase involved in cell wall biosynthesis
MRVVLNVDGADFRRAKWGTFARLWLRTSELLATHCADIVIADNREIVRRYAASYKVTPQFLSYGAIIRSDPVDCGELARWGLEPRKYILFVSRLTPENEAEILLEAYARWRGGMKLVICGSTNYETHYYKKLRALAVDGVIFTGARFEEAYWELSQKAAFFVMPAAIEATRLVLLDQMGMGSAILYRDVPATREVIDNAGEPFDSENPVASLCDKIELLASNPERCAGLRKLSLQRAEKAFSWREVTDEYEKLFASLGVATK